MSDIRFCRLVFAVALAVVLVGCGGEKPKMVAFTGKVVHKGQPVTAGSINFFPDSANNYQKDNPSSLLQIDGSFTAKTFPFGDGIPPGKYKVSLAPQLAGRLKAPTYGSPEMTPWKVEVPEGGLKDQVLEVKVVQVEAEEP